MEIRITLVMLSIQYNDCVYFRDPTLEREIDIRKGLLPSN